MQEVLPGRILCNFLISRAKKFQEMLRNHIPESNVGLAMIIKHRSGAGKIGEMHLVGQVKGSDCVIIDDMIDTAV
jgi:ribose-phosphate pyrophosphokinase